MAKKTQKRVIRPGLFKTIGKYKKTFFKAFLVLTLSLAYMGAEFSYYFQANILMDVRHKPFDGTIMPIDKIPDWSSLSEVEFDNIRNGFTRYEDLNKDSFIDLPKYDLKTLAKPRTPETSTIHNTYLTVYLGEYTEGLGNAIEGAGSHTGIDIRAPKGTPVKAIANAVVTRAGYNSTNGHFAVLRHDNVPDIKNPGQTTTYYSSYLHLDKVYVIQGEVINKGYKIGTVGNTGLSTTYHLHFQIDKEEAPFNVYWPFTWQEAEKAGLNFFEAVNEGLGVENGRKYTINPLSFVTSNIKYEDTTIIVEDNTNGDIIAITDDFNPVNDDTVIETQTKPEPDEEEEKTKSNPSTEDLEPNTPTPNINSNPVAALKVYPDTRKFELGESIILKINTVDSSGDKTIAPLTGSIEVKDLNNKPLKVLSGNLNFGNGTTRVEIKPTLGLPYKIFVGAGIINGVTEIYPKSNTQVFKDVSTNTFGKNAIEYFAKTGLTKGYTDGTFRPENKITRAELIKLTFETFDIALKPIRVASLSNDLDLNRWYSQYMYTAFENRVISGFQDGTLRPNDPVTQAQAMKIVLTTAQEIRNVEGTPWHTPYKQKLDELGVNPFEDYTPDTELSRAEAVEMLYQMVK